MACYPLYTLAGAGRGGAKAGAIAGAKAGAPNPRGCLGPRADMEPPRGHFWPLALSQTFYEHILRVEWVRAEAIAGAKAGAPNLWGCFGPRIDMEPPRGHFVTLSAPSNILKTYFESGVGLGLGYSRGQGQGS
jgi:hypothetical protein